MSTAEDLVRARYPDAFARLISPTTSIHGARLRPPCFEVRSSPGPDGKILGQGLRREWAWENAAENLEADNSGLSDE
ncbi:MAG: hypothetical protein KDA85_20755 [Planctomycetaceae bacterium]|nr:hypothetical protein [Planctomycetaceae bacterium]